METSLKRLVATAKSRWWIEHSYRELKDEFGLDHFEGRSWQEGITTSCCADGVCVPPGRTATLSPKKNARLSLPKLREELQSLLTCWYARCCMRGQSVPDLLKTKPP